MPLDLQSKLPPDPRSSLEEIYLLYADLARTSPLTPDIGLGGKLLYAGEMGGRGGSLLYAANIAGAASVAASASAGAQRQALREGMADFLVNSLEEALRILKNEIRKRQTVSVGIGADPRRIAAQMLERGVLPDLLPPASWSEAAAGMDGDQAARFLSQGARQIAASSAAGEEFVRWEVDRDFARWMPRLDGCAQSALPAGDAIRRRWLRLAPRYLGRKAQRMHGLALSGEERARFEAEVRALMAAEGAGGQEPIRVRIGGAEL